MNRKATHTKAVASVAVVVLLLAITGCATDMMRSSAPSDAPAASIYARAATGAVMGTLYRESLRMGDADDHEEGTISGQQQFDTESYSSIIDNPFLLSFDHPLSTFSIDVDTASYSNLRRFLTSGRLPPRDAVRIEELVNYFSYRYDPPATDDPFAVSTEVATCPWNADHRLLRIGIKGQELDLTERPASNLVFLVDVSGSMNTPDRLPLVKESLRLLVNELDDRDRIAMVAYAGASGLVLPAVACSERKRILDAIDRLEAGGSTNGGAGIQLAYQVAQENFITDGVNRVILCTDGDFNVGVSSEGELVRLIEEKRTTGVFLSVLGYGTGNYQDSKMEQLSNKGNGNYGYVDSLREARKILVEQLSSTLVTIAKDVKIQIEFNPTKVGAYRLIGYENRLLRKQDFNDDTKDAGEIGAGHCVTALYEIVPAGREGGIGEPASLKYQMDRRLTNEAFGAELLNVKLRHKRPDADESELMTVAVMDDGRGFESATEDFRWAASVAAFGMILRDSPHKGSATLDGALAMASGSLGPDEQGYRTEFVSLIERARTITGEAEPKSAEPMAQP